MKKWFGVCLMLSVLVACTNKKLADGVKEGEKNPDGIPEIDSRETRELVKHLNIDSLASEIGLYTPDACVRWVKITKNDVAKEVLEFTNSDGCSDPEFIASEESQVAFRLTVMGSDGYYTIHSSKLNSAMGRITGSEDALEISELCTGNFLLDESQVPSQGVCRLVVNGGLWNAGGVPYYYSGNID